MPKRFTAGGDDPSTELRFSGMDTRAVTPDEASHPLIPGCNHRVLWNLPILTVLPEGLLSLGGAMQGMAYGRHVYKEPKPPRWTTMPMFSRSMPCTRA